MKTGARMMIIMAAVLTGLAAGEAAPARQQASPAGFVAAIQGKGNIIRNRDRIMISGMDLLYPGDSVQLSKSARARISLCGGKGHEIRGAADFTIRAAGVLFRQGRAHKAYEVDRKSCAAALEVFMKNEKKLPELVTGGRKGTLILRSRKKGERRGVYVVRGRKQLPLIELLSDRIMPDKPLIFWSQVKGRDSYRVAVKGAGETLWSSTAAKNSCEYPVSAPPLAEGREYDIVIEAVDAAGTVIAEGNGTISVFSGKELESLGRDEASIKEMMPDTDAGRHVLLGRLYEAHGRLADALASYEKALSLDSGNTGLRERVSLLRQMME